MASDRHHCAPRDRAAALDSANPGDAKWSNGGGQRRPESLRDFNMAGATPPTAWTDEASPHKSDERTRSRQRNGRAASGQTRICNKCGEPLTGQFVRALDGIFHLNCFKCRDCGEIVASKFFPADDENSQGHYPLCETDYFRRLDLICHQCGGALRGSYITALERKYHVDHFTCSLCTTVFGAQDSYYEHDGNVFCHYHYSTRHAQRCYGCQTAILKQFVEIYRNGQNQHWHLECYMIHKFWNVRLAQPTDTPPAAAESDDPASRELIRRDEERMEEKVYHIWSILSTFEESSAACISDMLLHVSNGSYVDGFLVAKRFIWHVEVLFKSADRLEAMMLGRNSKGMSYGREAKLLCKKIVAFFSLLSKAQDTSFRKLGVTQELLSLVTGLAHYLKLLIRICLQGSIRLEREAGSSDGINQLLDDLADFETYKTDEGMLQLAIGGSRLSEKDSDHCVACGRSVEDECAKCGDTMWHLACLKCTRCARELGRCLREARYKVLERKAYCTGCSPGGSEASPSFEPITKLKQYVFLLKVALARLLDILRSSGALPSGVDAKASDHGGDKGMLGAGPPFLNSKSRSKSYAGGGDKEHRFQSTYETTLNEVRRLRSTRLDRHLSSSVKQARTSLVMTADSRAPRADSADGQEGAAEAQGSTDLMFGQKDAINLDDIPRIVAVEHSREKQQQQKQKQKQRDRGVRPDAFRPPAGDAGRSPARHRAQSVSKDHDVRPDHLPARAVVSKFFSELSGLEFFNVRHLAVLTMQPMIEQEFSLDELLGFIESRKPPTFWKNLGKAFKNDKNRNGKKKGVFGVPLEVIIDRDGADSTDGVGPGTLRIPAIIDDIILSMRKMDLSVEGVFRKNGNIKKQQELVDKVNAEGCDVVNFMEQPVVQLAALLKRYLRDLPDPLMTHKLYRLWISAAKISDAESRKQCLHMTFCLLPKCHRDCLESLFTFLKWAGSFHQLDEDVGSKMDIRNLATVIAPNILTNPNKALTLDSEAIFVIDAVEILIANIEEMCQVPDELLTLLNDPYLFSNTGEATTKEIIKRFQDRRGQAPVAEVSEVFNRLDTLTRSPPKRVETDPAVLQSERPVRPVQDQGGFSGQETSPHKWTGGGDGASPYNNGRFNRSDSQLDSSEHSQRVEWRKSAWGRRGGGVGIDGNS